MQSIQSYFRAVVKGLTLTRRNIKAELAARMQRSLELDREKVQWDHMLLVETLVVDFLLTVFVELSILSGHTHGTQRAHMVLNTCGSAVESRRGGEHIKGGANAI